VSQRNFAHYDFADHGYPVRDDAGHPGCDRTGGATGVTCPIVHKSFLATSAADWWRVHPMGVFRKLRALSPRVGEGRTGPGSPIRRLGASSGILSKAPSPWC